MEQTAQNNIYLMCLEKGYECGDAGISYNGMLSFLKEKDVNTNDLFKKYFLVWFFDNFYNSNIHFSRTTNRTHVDTYDESSIRQYFDVNCPLMYEARQKWLNYLHLTNSNEMANHSLALAKAATDLAKSSNRLANWAFKITILASMASIIIGLGQLYYAKEQHIFNQKNIIEAKGQKEFLAPDTVKSKKLNSEYKKPNPHRGDSPKQHIKK